MSLGQRGTVSEYGCQSFQADDRTVQPSPKTLPICPDATKLPGIFMYKGFHCMVVPVGGRFSIIILNGGNPIKVEWRWIGDGKLRDSWGTKSLACLNAKIFISYHIRKKRMHREPNGNPILKLAGQMYALGLTNQNQG